MRRLRIPQRAPIFVGCEGLSEMGYAGWLRNLARDRQLPVHLELSDLGKGAGDPLARIELAVDRIDMLERNRVPFVRRFALLDTDQLALNANRANQARALAQRQNLTVIWQVPTHEAFLLRHLPNRVTRNPANAQIAQAALVQDWPAYAKPMSAKDIESRLDLAGAWRLAGRLAELAQLLNVIGLVEP
jgi:hypothetical protein